MVEYDSEEYLATCDRCNLDFPKLWDGTYCPYCAYEVAQELIRFAKENGVAEVDVNAKV